MIEMVDLKLSEGFLEEARLKVREAQDAISENQRMMEVLFEENENWEEVLSGLMVVLNGGTETINMVGNGKQEQLVVSGQTNGNKPPLWKEAAEVLKITNKRMTTGELYDALVQGGRTFESPNAKDILREALRNAAKTDEGKMVEVRKHGSTLHFRYRNGN